MKHKYERVYVKVNANFDSTEYMQPLSIIEYFGSRVGRWFAERLVDG